MSILKSKTGLYTDMYQLSMMYAYFKDGRYNTPAAFNYFFRKLPFGGGFTVFAGLQELIAGIGEMRFDRADIEYLAGLRFHDDFLDYLRSFEFKGNIISAGEGSIIFPNEPVLTVTGNLAEVQLLETLLLNTLNFNSLIATKAARIRLAAPDKIFSEFGLRRANGLGGVQASKAAVIGGFDSTSNVFAAKEYGLKAEGTMAHSYIQSFDDELTAFRHFARAHPDNCILLVDTYNTLKSGVPNAVIVGKEMQARGEKLKGIRLDSGDLAYLAKESRRMLDEAGLHHVKIAASNQLDEDVVKSLIEQNAPIDIFGVGTSLATGAPDGALDGVYKLVMAEGKPKLKVSENIQKTTLPGIKKIIRYADDQGFFRADAVLLEEEENIEFMIHPYDREKRFSFTGLKGELLTKPVIAEGQPVMKERSVYEIRETVKYNLSRLEPEYKRFINPHVYKVGVSENLLDLRDRLKQQ